MGILRLVRWIGYIGYFVYITMIVVGAVFYDHRHCPAENIALFLILGGVISLVGSIVSKIAISIKPSNVDSRNSKKLGSFEYKVITNSDTSIFNEFKVKTTAIVDVVEQPVKFITSIEDGDGDKLGEVVAEVRLVSPWKFILRCLSMILDWAAFSVFITTSILVFRLYPNVDYENKGDTNNYCNPGLFLFALTYLLVVYSLIIILLLVFISCRVCCAYCSFSILPDPETRIHFHINL